MVWKQTILAWDILPGWADSAGQEHAEPLVYCDWQQTILEWDVLPVVFVRPGTLRCCPSVHHGVELTPGRGTSNPWSFVEVLLMLPTSGGTVCRLVEVLWTSSTSGGSTRYPIEVLQKPSTSGRSPQQLAEALDIPVKSCRSTQHLVDVLDTMSSAC